MIKDSLRTDEEASIAMDANLKDASVPVDANGEDASFSEHGNEDVV